MALTQKIGALANAGAQAQSISQSLANMAANLHYTGSTQPQKSYGQEYTPSYQPAYQPQQQGSFSSGGSAAAAQHIIQQARNQQVTRQNVFNDVAKQAVLSALAVATGQQPGRQYTAPPTLQYRQGASALQHQLTPEQEGQLFDQQIQATKLAASPTAWMDPSYPARAQAIGQQVDQMRSGFTNAHPNPRLTQEQQVLSAFPQMTPQELRPRSNDQLGAMLSLAQQPPASAAGTPDQPTATVAPVGEMTHNQPPIGPPKQPAYSPLPTWNTTRGVPAQPPYSPLPSGAAMVSAAFQDALNRGATMQQVQGGQMADGGGGGFWDTVGGVVDAGLHAGGPVNPIALFESLVQNGKDIASYLAPDFVDGMLGQLKDGAAGTYEEFMTSAPGQVIASILNGLDAGRQWNTGNVGALAYRTATKSPFLGPGDWDSDHYISLMPPLALAFEAAYKADPSLEAKVVDWHDNGYSSPSYIKTVEVSGMTMEEAGPQFTGDQAVYEGLMGLTDDMPDVLKYPFRMATDVLLDPLAMLTVASRAGALARELGIGLRTADEASLGARVLGGVLEGTGAAVEGGARLPDLPVEALVKGGGKVGGRIGEVTGLLSPSTAGLRRDAEAAAADLDTAITGARESIPDQESRISFDAEAQGVAPTSGPELIETPARAEAPTVTNQVGGESTVTRSTGTMTVERTPTIASDPRFASYATAVEASEAGKRLYADWMTHYGDTLVGSGSAKTELFSGAGLGEDFVPRRITTPAKGSIERLAKAPDGYAIVKNADGTWSPTMSAETKAAKAGEPISPPAPSAHETALADVKQQIKENQALLKSGNPDKMLVATEKLKILHKEFDRLRGEVAAEKAAAAKPKPAPPTTKVERDAAAAAGSTPDTPRSTGASETVRAAETAKESIGTGKKKRLTAAERKSYSALAKAQDRSDRLAREDAAGLPKQVNKILGAQKPGEHEFSPIYGGHRPLDQIVTKAIDSKDPALMKKADAFVKKVDQAVEQHLRTDDFYKTWKNGGTPVFTYSPSGGLADDFFEAFRVFEPDADIGRLRVLANGLAKGTLDDIAELQFQLGHLFPMLMQDYADEFTLDGVLGAVGRIESRDFRAESSKWLIREYLDTPDPAKADTILHTFLTGETEVPIIADGVHKPYAHSIVPEQQAESIARLQEMRGQWRTIKRAQQVKRTSGIARYSGVDAVPNVEYGGDKVVARLRWRANKEGGQRFGNYEVIRERPDGTLYSEIHRDDMPPNEWLNIRDVDEGYLRRSKATGWARQVTDFNAPVSVKWGSVADSSLPTTKFLEFMREQEALGLDDETLMGRRTEFLESVPELSDAAYRAADVPAQLEGGKKSVSKQMAAAMRATKHSVKASDEAITTAIGEIKDAEIAHWLLNGDGKLTVEQARLADRPMPATWKPTGYVGSKTEWNVKDALDWAREESLRNASFDHRKAVDEIGQLAHGLQPKRTAAEVRSMRKAAEAAGIDPKTIKDGTSMGERLAATKAIKALDWKMRNLRAFRLYNIIVGLGNRIGDIAGNSVAHLIGSDVRSAVRQVPLTFTETGEFRKLLRDPAKLGAEWVKDTPHMAETGMVYPTSELFGNTKLSEVDPGSMLPPLQGKLEKWNAPRGVKWAANLWTATYLKDMTTAGEMTGRKLAFDRVYTETIQREAWPAFKEYLEGRFPGQSDQMLKEIYKSAQEKGGKSWGGYFSAGDVQKAVDEDAARAWQRELNRASDKGVTEADHLFFKGKMTNADEIARRTLTFHFWMVRASALYGRTLLRNPVLLSGFYRLHQQAQQIAEEQGLPGFLGTMFKFMSIPGAGSGYVAGDPINILFPLFFLDMYNQEGNKFQALQNLLIPEWSAALGALGLTQNVPDLTGTRSLERFVIDMGNFLKGEGVDLEAIPGFGQYINTDSLTFKIPTEEFTKALIAKANDLVGEPLGTFKPFDRAANEHDQLYSIGEQVAQGLWGEDMTQWSASQVAELTAAVTQAQYGDGEETWLSETIRAAYGREGAARAFGALAIPGGVVTRQGFRDNQIELSHGYWNDFYAGKGTTKAGESAALGRQLATSAQPAWIAMNNDYYQIGTKQEQTMYSSVNDMLYSPGDLNPNQSIIIDNGNGMFTVYSMAQLAGLSDDDRQQVVYAWLDQNQGVSDAFTKVKDGRAAFKDEHPDYAQYAEYQKGVFGYSGGPTQFRRDMQDNPTFKAAEDAERDRLKKEGKSGAVLEAELDHWATTQQAFFAATGQKYKTTDQVGGTPGPSSVAAMFSLRPDKESSGSSTKKEAPKDPTVDDYWSPAKGVPRLAQDQAQYQHDNAAMESTFGQYWNEATGDWEDNADSASERKKLGIGDVPYVMPSVSETMRRYEEWEYRNPGGSPEEFFAEMLQTEGFGKKVGGGTKAAPALPGGTVITKPAGVAAYPNTPIGRLQAATQSMGVRRESAAKPVTSSTPRTGKVVITGGKSYPLSQDYGMTDFAQGQIGPDGMYGYTDQYTTDGSYVGHMGVDIGVPLGTELYAPVSGKVVQSGGVPFEYDDRYRDQDGNALPNTGGLRIELPNGDIVVMAHMQQITVNVGDTVQAGQPVGYSGESNGPHVHVEYRQYAPGQTGSGYLAVDPRTKLDLGV